MLLLYSFDMKEESDCIVNAVDKVLNAGLRTADLCRVGTPLTCSEMTKVIIENL